MDFDSWIQGSSKKHHAEVLIQWNKNSTWWLIAFEDSERSIRRTNCLRYHNIAFCSSFFRISIGGSFFKHCCNRKNWAWFAGGWDKRGRTDEELHWKTPCWSNYQFLWAYQAAKFGNIFIFKESQGKKPQ